MLSAKNRKSADAGRKTCALDAKVEGSSGQPGTRSPRGDREGSGASRLERTAPMLVVHIALLSLSLGAGDKVRLRDRLAHLPSNLWVRDSAARSVVLAPAVAARGATFEAPWLADSQEDLLAHDRGYQKWQRVVWFWRDRVLPDGTRPSEWGPLDGWLQANRAPVLRRQPGVAGRIAAVTPPLWRSIGQTSNTGGYNGQGRTTSVAFDKADTNRLYVGAPIGGIWKSGDAGRTWTPKGDSLPYVAAGDIQVDHANPSVVYAAIGDHGGWWNYSLGVWKSLDGGNTWNPTGLQKKLSDGMAIYALEMSPTDSRILLAATSQGLYATRDAGTTWTRLKDGVWTDVKFRPKDGAVVWAAFEDWSNAAQVFRSTDSGRTFAQASQFTRTGNSMKLATTPADPDRVLALWNNRQVWVGRSQGTSWAKTDSACPEQAVLMASPAKADRMYCGYVNLYRTDDAGKTWKQISNWASSPTLPEVHADQHCAKSNPWAPDQLYFCNDGGLVRYRESTSKFEELSNGLVISQFYDISTAQSDSEIVIGGTQDNGGRMRLANGAWKATNGGDAMVTALDPRDAKVMYTTYCNGLLYRSLDGWTKDTYKVVFTGDPASPTSGDGVGAWAAPYVLDPNNPDILVAGYSDVYRSLNRGDTWTAISGNLTGGTGNDLDEVAVATGDSRRIWASRGSTVWRTTDLGATWKSAAVPVGERVSQILPDPRDPARVWASTVGYQAGKKVWESLDGGATWKNLSGALLNVPANALALDSTTRRLFAGTDAGVWVRPLSGADTGWSLYGRGLPFTAATDLEIQWKSRVLRAATFGRGVWEVALDGTSGPPVPVPGDLARSAQAKVRVGPGAIEVRFDPTDRFRGEVLVVDAAGRVVARAAVDKPEGQILSALSLARPASSGLSWVVFSAEDGTRRSVPVARP